MQDPYSHIVSFPQSSVQQNSLGLTALVSGRRQYISHATINVHNLETSVLSSDNMSNSSLSDLHFYVHVSSFSDGEAQIRYLVLDEEVRNLRIALRLYDGP